MGDDWQAGDLALCVALTIRNLRPSRILRLGAIYTVTGTRWSNKEQCIALSLAEAKSNGPLGDWHSAVFRKIRPHRPDAEDAETLRLLNGQPVRETV